MTAAADMPVFTGETIFERRRKREGDNGYESRNTGRLRWGNIMAFTGWSRIQQPTFGNVNAAFTHYSSTLKGDYYQGTEANYVSGKVQPGTALTTSAYEAISISAPMLPTSCISALIIFTTVFIRRRKNRIFPMA